MEFIEILKAILIGIVEGITEWLPVSSTGHMILLDEFITLNVREEFMEMFLVVIQLGAILAVPTLFLNKLLPFGKTKTNEEKGKIWSLWAKVIVGVIPAAILGLLFDDLLEGYLYNAPTVAAALIIYGIAFIIVEKLKKDKAPRVDSVYDLSYTDALKIGAFQVLSLIPGTSRSGSTILGGIISGVSRSAASEFSFFMAIPVMLGASLLKVVKFLAGGFSATLIEIVLLLVGIAVSYLVSLFVIKFLMNFVSKHTFIPFGIYRIALGTIIIIYFALKFAGVLA